MSIRVQIDDKNLKAFGRALKALPEREWPFATALSVTRTAGQATDAMKVGMRRRFTIRRPWLLRQVRFTKATKANLEAKVFMTEKTEYFAELQEEGGHKKIGSKSLAIPTDKIKNTKGLVRKANRPSGLLKKTNRRTGYFIATAGNGSGLYKRTRRNPIELLFRFRRSVKIKPRLGLESTVRKVVNGVFPKTFAKAIADIERQLERRAQR